MCFISFNYPEVSTDDEGGVHIYQEIDASQGPILPPRNSIKKKQESRNRNKSSLERSSTGKEKNTRSSKKYGREDSTAGKTCPTIERINEDRGGIAKGGEAATRSSKSSPIYYNKDCDSIRRVSSKRSKSTSSSTSCPHESPWELSPEGVHMCGRIGAGSFGQVWKGMIEGKPVAVKMLNGT